MSLLIEPEDIEAVRTCIDEHQGKYYDIVPLENQIRSRRDRYC